MPKCYTVQATRQCMTNLNSEAKDPASIETLRMLSSQLVAAAVALLETEQNSQTELTSIVKVLMEDVRWQIDTAVAMSERMYVHVYYNLARHIILFSKDSARARRIRIRQRNRYRGT